MKKCFVTKYLEECIIADWGYTKCPNVIMHYMKMY